MNSIFVAIDQACNAELRNAKTVGKLLPQKGGFRGCGVQQTSAIANRMRFVAPSHAFYTLYARFRGYGSQQMREITHVMAFDAPTHAFYTLCASFRV